MKINDTTKVLFMCIAMGAVIIVLLLGIVCVIGNDKNLCKEKDTVIKYLENKIDSLQSEKFRLELTIIYQDRVLNAATKE